MRFELHTAGTRSPATLLGEFATFDAVRDAFTAGPVDGREPWAIVPSGTAAELASLGNLDSIAPRYGSAGCYVLRCGDDGFSTLGFDYAERCRSQAAEWLESEGAPLPRPAGFPPRPGTPAHFAAYSEALAAGAAHASATGKRCPAHLTAELIGLEGKRVEIVDSYGERRRFYVGKSTGWFPIHLEIARRNSSGGGGVTGAPFRSVSVIGERAR